MKRFFAIMACTVLLSSCNRTYNLVFDDISGINVNTEVRANGMRVGQVEGLYLLPDGSVLVKVEIERDVIVPQDSKFSYTGSGSFAENSLSFEAGKSSKMLSVGDTIPGIYEQSNEQSVASNPVVEKVTDFLEAISKQDSILKRMENLDAKVDSLYRIISKKNSAN